MLVSVAVPAFNQSGYLRDALASALAQTHTELEVVVVDDGSTDDTRAVCEAFGDPRIRYLYQDNDGTRGIGARNRAILEARGEWIALLDQDDLWLPDKLRQQLAAAQAAPRAAAVFCLAEFIDASGAVTGRQDRDAPDGEVYARLLRSNLYYVSTGMFRRSALGVGGLPSESCGFGDWSLWLLLARHFPFAVVREYLTQYRLQPQSYLAQLRSVDRQRHAMDHLKVLDAQRHRLPPGSRECAHYFAKGLRDTAKLFLGAAFASLQAGEFGAAARDIGNAARTAPRWFFLPWTLVYVVATALAYLLRLRRA